MPRFLNARTNEPVLDLGHIPAEAYAIITRPEPGFVFDDEDFDRLDEEERVLGEFGLVRINARPKPVIKCPLCRSTTSCEKASEVPSST